MTSRSLAVAWKIGVPCVAMVAFALVGHTPMTIACAALFLASTLVEATVTLRTDLMERDRS